MKSILLNLLLVFTLIAAPTANLAQAAGPITFGKTTFDNKFPNSLTFMIHAGSTAGQIVKARLYYKLRNEASYTQIELQFDPASEVDLSYTWKTDKASIPPSAPILYQWEATDSTGNTVKSDEQTFRYDDVNYHWKTRENGDLSVWWHDRPDGFGQQVFDIATQAFTKLHGVFNARLDYPIRIIIYNDFAEFKQWNKFFSEVYGGQAFPELGLTVQIVEAYQSEEQWLNEVIPHEITHLYFYQATYHPLSNPPAWLNEGLARYNEFRDKSGELRAVRRYVLDGNLISLRGLTGGFGSVDETKVAYSYAESLSAVTYLIARYGDTGMADLLAAFKAGKSYKAAFVAALGVTPDEFERGWLDSMGVPSDMYPTPTPFPTLQPIPSPAFGLPITSAPHRTSTPATTPAPRPSPTPQPVATASPTATPTPIMESMKTDAVLPIGLIVVLIAGIALTLVGIRRLRA